MPAINFQTQFAPKILDGTKVFTLRALRKDRRDPKMGDRLYLFTAMRTKKCRKIAEQPCRFAAMILLSHRSITIPGLAILTNEQQMEAFARLDGFGNYHAFCQFHEIKAGMTTKSMRLIAWVTREELEKLVK